MCTKHDKMCYGECLAQSGDYDGNYYYRFGDCKNEELCIPYECPNFHVCGTVAQHWYFLCHSGLCMNCRVLGREILLFMDQSGGIMCPVCLEDEPFLAIYSCGHYIGTMCISDIYNDDIPTISPVEFGAPDDDYDKWGEWPTQEPEMYAAYMLAEDNNEDILHERAKLRGLLHSQCPICRDKRGLHCDTFKMQLLCANTLTNAFFVPRPDLMTSPS